MKFAIPVIVLAMLTAVGCQQQAAKPATASETPSMDLTPITPQPVPVAYTAPAPTASYSSEPMMTSTTPAMGAAGNSGATYTVRKGDTLWKIAATRLGDGKKWKLIAAANPGLSPSSLKVGQTISLPM